MKLPVYYKITSQVHGKVLNVRISDQEVYDETINDDDFKACNPVKLSGKPKGDFEDACWTDFERFRYCEEEMWNIYNIPIYAIYRICKKVLDPNDELDYYEVPDTFALNQRNRDLELNDEEIKNIDDFLDGLHKKMPEGFEISWDEQSCGSPFFSKYPEFGLGSECVCLRVYPKNLERLKV